MNFKSFLLIALMAPWLAFSQSSLDRQLQDNRSRLQDLRRQISEIKKQLTKSRSQEKDILQQISLIDQEVALLSRAKGVLTRQSQLLQRKINHTSARLQTTTERYNKLRSLYAQRVVYAYKYGKVRNLELLLSASSFNQALIRYRYLKIIAEHDARTIKSILKKKREIQRIKAELADQLAGKKETLRQKQIEEKQYLTRKNEKKRLVAELHRRQQSYSQQLAQKQKEKENLIAMIVELERKRKLAERRTEAGREIVHFDFKDFKRAKGKLPWPVRGKVITHYGKQRDPKSKTYIKNTDIEIRSKLGTDVRCVFKGLVRVITYLPGYGNTVIVDHGKGFYTVYSHLDEIYVDKGQGVDTGQVIATVGDSGSLAGARLQFGIYGGRKTYNPEKWLRRN